MILPSPSCFELIMERTNLRFQWQRAKNKIELWAVRWSCSSKTKQVQGMTFTLMQHMCTICFLMQLFPQILTIDEVSKIGKISKQWTGLLREAFTDSDNFGIQFPMDLDVKIKAVMIGACFLIVSSTFTYLLIKKIIWCINLSC